jgi:hypothetical protein
VTRVYFYALNNLSFLIEGSRCLIAVIGLEGDWPAACTDFFAVTGLFFLLVLPSLKKL